MFPSASVVDRRNDPRYGYRAIHIIVKILGQSIEVQVRTELQHKWAELSEKLSDKIDPAIKYGGGDKIVKKLLLDLSDLVKNYEDFEKNFPGSIDNDRNSKKAADVKIQVVNLIKKYIEEKKL